MIKKTFFDFCTQVLTVFAFIMIALNVFCLVIGARAKEYSAIFSLSDQGIPAGIVFQFLIAAFLIVGIKYLFEADLLIRKIPYQIRMLCMMALIFVIIAVLAVLFHWFSIDQGGAWALFILCCAVSFLGSFLLSAMRMRLEDKRLEEALKQLKSREENTET